MHDSLDNRWLCIELSSIEYREAWRLQTDLVAARKDNIIDTNVILLLEHPPVFTLGRRSGLNNVTVSEDFLKKTGIPVIQVERGGDVTFHGPGQLVIYPIINLQVDRLRVVDYVEYLEEVMIRAAADWGIKAERNPINRGVWVGNNKLGSIGIAVRRGICFHGIAFNINLSLKPFGWINPCGLQDIGMTSMQRELSRKVSMNEVRKSVKRHVQAVFGVELVMTNLSELEGLLHLRKQPLTDLSYLSQSSRRRRAFE
jgi:lipoate-protein ligase B